MASLLSSHRHMRNRHTSCSGATEAWLICRFLQELPETGIFVSNCPHHVSMLDNTIWGEMEVATLDSDSVSTLTYKQVIR